jgi:hypothetical protein
LACAARQRGALLVNGRDHRRAERRKPEHLRDHAHGVGGELSGAGAEGRDRRALERVQFLGGHRAGHHRAGGFVGGQYRHRFPVQAAGQGRAAEDEDGRRVAADHRHHDARQILVAAAEADEAVIGMAAHDQLDRIRDHLARYQRAFHALMIHADTVGDRNGRECARRAARAQHAFLCVRRLLGECAVAWRGVAGGGDNADERPRDGRIVESHAAHESAVRGAVDAVGGDPRTKGEGGHAEPHDRSGLGAR